MATTRAATRDAVWPLIRAFGRPFRFKELWAKTSMHESSVREYLALLVRAGLVQRDGHSYRLVRDVGIDAPFIAADGRLMQRQTKTEAIWRAARILGEFNSQDIANALKALEITTARSGITDYLGNLRRSGYLALVKPAGNAQGAWARYRFISARYTGPKPPQVQRSTAIYDPNTQRIVWQSPLTPDADEEVLHPAPAEQGGAA